MKYPHYSNIPDVVSPKRHNQSLYEFLTEDEYFKNNLKELSGEHKNVKHCGNNLYEYTLSQNKTVISFYTPDGDEVEWTFLNKYDKEIINFLQKFKETLL